MEAAFCQGFGLTVQGPAIVNEEGGEGERGEDDGLLAPMPTFPPAAQAVVTESVPVASSPERASTVGFGGTANILILAALVILVGVVLLRLGRKSG